MFQRLKFVFIDMKNNRIISEMGGNTQYFILLLGGSAKMVLYLLPGILR